MTVINSDNGHLWYVIEPIEQKIVKVCWSEEEAWRLAGEYANLSIV